MKTEVFYGKLRIYFKLFILAILYFMCINAYSQKPKLCGGYKINTDELLKALQFEKSNKSLSSQHYLIRVYFHIVRYDDGSHEGATPTDIQNEFQTLQSDYAPGNICFLNAGYDYVNSTELDTVDATQSGSDALFDYAMEANCLNIFYTYVINGKNGNCNCGIGGVTFTLPATFCLVSKGNIGAGHTISHEVGHCFGLLHTFDASQGIEDIDESNCSSAGDLICDTKADPYLYKNNSCFSVEGCTYNGSCTDPNGASNYDPPYTNMMAYWWAYGCYPNLFITANQFTRINSFLNTNSDLINCESPASVTEGPLTLNGGDLMVSAVNDLNTSGVVNINGGDRVTIGGGTVYLNPGFHATPQPLCTVCIISIIGSDCHYTSFNAIAKANTQIESKALSNNIENKLSLYPNPSSSIVHVLFTKDINEKDVSLCVYDIDNKKLRQMNLEYLPSAKQDVALDVHDFLSGIYFVVVRTNVRTLSAKLIIAK